MKPLLPWKGNKFYIFLCVCVCVLVWVLGRACARVAIIIQHATLRRISAGPVVPHVSTFS
jgi:hypothetical protein